ncbi:MAG: MdtA/MuxA family multidrug efflux RND transporter periplasmic adaptor subunit [Candidatus Acidiferrales bacterium]
MGAMHTVNIHETIPASPGREPQVRPPSRKRWLWVLIIVLLAIGAYAYYRVRSDAAANAAAAKARANVPAVSVGVAPVRQRDVPYYLTALGTVIPYNTVTVHSRVDGELMKVYFKEGQFVRKGELLAEIDPRPYQVALEQAQGQLAKDEALQKDAQVDLGRYQTLWQEGVAPRQQVDTQQAVVGQSDGAIKADQAMIDTQKLQLTYSKITAPITGRVGLRLVDVGNIVHAADTTGMLVITQVQPIAVDFTLPEGNINEVITRMRSQQLVVEAYSQDDKTKLADGKLLTIDNQIDTTTGTVKLKSEFANATLSLWPNEFVNVRLFLSVRKNAIVLTSAAIQKTAQGSFVYVVDSNNEAQMRPVQLDFVEGNVAVIKQGLSASDQVVVDGQDKLQPGSKVAPHPAPTARTLESDPAGGSNQ